MAAAAGNGSGDRAYSAARSSWGAGGVGSPREWLRARGRVVPRVTRTGRAGVLDTQHRSRVARTGVDEPGCVRGPASSANDDPAWAWLSFPLHTAAIVSTVSSPSSNF